MWLDILNCWAASIVYLLAKIKLILHTGSPVSSNKLIDMPLSVQFHSVKKVLIIQLPPFTH